MRPSEFYFLAELKEFHLSRTLCVIPARMQSTRLPQKPMAMIGDKPLVLHTYEAAKKCSTIDELVVATDHEEIAKLISKHDGRVVMTPSDLKTGSDRVAFVAKSVNCDVVINLQGDEPFIKPQVLSELTAPFSHDPKLQMSTVASPLDWQHDYQNPDLVKAICDQQGYALYFSRSPIPFLRQEAHKEMLPVYKHMGLYAFRKDFLLKYTKLEQTPLEQAEALEQLRALENGVKIKVVLSEYRSVEVNTAAELEEARAYWKRQTHR